jgi:hypothetical protein
VTRLTVGCLLAVFAATTAAAQSPYVGGGIVVDIVRVSGSRDFGASGDGETVGGALRVGTSLGNRWGVDLEFARTGEIESQPDFRILADAFPGISPGLTIFPQPEISTRRQSSVVTTTLWWRQELGERFDLVYLGGAAFTRAETQLRIDIPAFPIPLPIGGVISPVQLIEQEAVSYGTGVAVGLDGRIWMTEHLRLVPGLRLLTIPGGWVVRPAVGIHWVF